MRGSSQSCYFSGLSGQIVFKTVCSAHYVGPGTDLIMCNLPRVRQDDSEESKEEEKSKWSGC